MNLNIRNDKDRLAMLAQGYRWITTNPYAGGRGRVFSRHRTYEAAHRETRRFSSLALDIVPVEPINSY